MIISKVVYFTCKDAFTKWRRMLDKIHFPKSNTVIKLDEYKLIKLFTTLITLF